MGLKVQKMVTRGDRWKIIRFGVYGALAFGVFFGIWAQNNMLTTYKDTCSIKDLPKSLVGMKIVHVGDFTNSHLDVVSAVRKADPDVIILSGGYCDPETGDYGTTANQIYQLSQIAPTVYIYSYVDEELYGDQDFLADTGALNIVNTYTVIQAPEISVSDFIRKNYGDGTANEINKSVNKYTAIKQSGGNPNEEMTEKELKHVKYYTYVQDELRESADACLRITGCQGNYDGDRQSAFDTVSAVTQQGNVGLDAVVLANIGDGEEVSKTQAKIMLVSGSFGTDFYGDFYKKGAYGYGASTLYICGGIGLNRDITHLGGIKTRVFNFPEIQCITLSDGTVTKKNALEKFLDQFIPDVGTIFDNDGGFTAE